MKRIYSFLRKVKAIVLREKSNKKVQNLKVNSEYVVVGKNTDIENLRIDLIGKNHKKPCVVIGDDCLLSGNIVIYSDCGIVSIGDRVFVGPNTTFFCYAGVKIESDVMISWGCTIIDTNAHSLVSSERLNDVVDWKKGPEFKNWANVSSECIFIRTKSWIGFNSIITKGVEINEGAIVACGSVVTKSVDPYTVVAGNPAKFVKQTI